MIQWRSSFFAVLGDPRRTPLEDRLLNAICLLNGIANLGGVPQAASLPDARELVMLHVITGILFLGLYLWSRLRGGGAWLAGIAILLIGAFLMANVRWNSGSYGGAHYYWIPALVIGIIVTRTTLQKAVALSFFIAATITMFLLEHQTGVAGGITTETQELLWWDRALNFVFVQLFTGGLVWILATNLREERRRAENLLLNILPSPVAEELKNTDEVVPRHFAETTVLFTDFVGFTQYSEALEPQRLVRELDECFREFDQIIAQHGLEKIKTIGDAYMAVAGIPDPLTDHAEAAIQAAIEIRTYIHQRSLKRGEQGLKSWDIRIGLNSGPLVAGVIGRHKFIYDVWGDTVNTASRMESAGMAGEINFSQSTHDQIQHAHTCEYRGTIDIKGKGELGMYRLAD